MMTRTEAAEAARRASKAIAGFAGATLAALGAAMADGDITRPEVIVAVGAGLVVGGGLVYSAPANIEPGGGRRIKGED